MCIRDSIYSLHFQVFQVDLNEALNSCCFINEHKVAIGQQNGTIAVVDIRNSRYNNN